MLNAYLFITSHIVGLKERRDERGATAVEYGLMVALIAIIIITAVALVGTNLTTVFNDVAGKLKGIAPGT